MFCKNCGKPIEEDAKFCANCGEGVNAIETAAPVETAAQEAPEVQEVPAAPVPNGEYAPVVAAPNGNKKKLFIIIGAAAAAIVAAIVVFFCFFYGNSPEAVAEKFATALAEYDAESLVECVPDFMIEEAAEQYDVSADRDAVAKAIQETYDENIDDDDMPKDFKVLGTVISEDYFDQEDKEDFIKECKEYYDVVVEDVCVVEVNYTAVFDGEEETEYMDVTCAKIDGTWYVMD